VSSSETSKLQKKGSHSSRERGSGCGDASACLYRTPVTGATPTGNQSKTCAAENGPEWPIFVQNRLMRETLAALRR
jgi:hypothetical protein